MTRLSLSALLRRLVESIQVDEAQQDAAFAQVRPMALKGASRVPDQQLSLCDAAEQGARLLQRGVAAIQRLVPATSLAITCP